MKPKNFITILTLSGLIVTSCSTGLQVSNSSSWNDEIYGSSTKPKVENEEKTQEYAQKVNPDLDKLEQKYSDVLDINLDSVKNDTVIYKAEETNPYKRILSDSYEDSYERRLKGLNDPWYGMENWSVYYSDDWRYVQAYDPAFYNVVVMGDQVWVEPWYISGMFAWPRSHFSVGIGLGWGYSFWNYSPWYWQWNYPYYYSAYDYWPYYYSYPPYRDGWDNNYWYGNNTSPYYGSGYYYGRRTSSSTNISSARRYSSGLDKISSDQAISTSTRRATTTSTNPIVSTKTSQTRITPTYETRGRRGGTVTNQVAISRRSSITDNTNKNSVVQTRTSKPTRAIGISEPTRRSYNPTYERPRTTMENGTTRRTEQATMRGSSVTRQPSTTTRTTTPTYNRPGRVSTPGSMSSGGSRTQENVSSGGSGGSYNPSKSSSSSSTRASGSSSSSGSSSRRK